MQSSCRYATIIPKEKEYLSLVILGKHGCQGIQEYAIAFLSWGIDVRGSSLKVHHLPGKQNMNN